MSEAPEARLEQVDDDIYAYVQPDGTWFLNNCGFVVGPDDVTVVDMTSTETRSRAFMGALRETTPLPVGTLVNTHAHADHTHGNAIAGASVIVGHERCRDEVIAFGVKNPALDNLFPGVDWGELEPAPPTLTFRDRLTLYAGDLALELMHLGPAHTTNDVVVWIPARRLLFAGDLCFNGGHPNNVGGSIVGTRQVMAALGDLGAETVVPGHGDVCGPEIFAAMTSYMEWVDDVARRGIEAGVSPLEAARAADFGPFAAWTDPERLVGNLHRAYAEIQEGDVNVMAAFGDMVTYNGGPLHCIA